MLRFILVLQIALLCSLSLFSQGKVNGAVRDSLKNEAVEFASVRLLNLSDSSFVKGVVSNVEGRFSMDSNYGGFLLEISFMGYVSHYETLNLSKNNPKIDLGDILLKEDALVLDEAVVTAKIPDILVKGDTIEYNADAYISEENALLQDVLKRIPGIELDGNGGLKANGKPITKILVDGKEFFGNDIEMALKNLPANMIKKLQLFKEQSETSKITGFKDGKEEQVLNLTVKEEYKKSLFGDVKIGGGNNGRYANRAMVNYMSGENQLSAVGNIDNTNGDLDFSGQSYMALSGLDKNQNGGVSFYTQKSPKFKIGGNARYSDNSNLFESENNTETFLSGRNRFSTQSSSSTNGRKSLNIGSNIEWQPDSLTTIYFRVSGNYNENRDIRHSENKSYVSGKDTTQGWSDYRTKGDGRSVNSSLVIGRKLNDKGRNLSLSLSGSFRKEASDGNNYSFTSYSSDIEDKIIDQRLNTDNKTTNWSMSLSYVEPISEKNSLMMSYSVRQNRYNRDKNTYKQDLAGNYAVIDSAYTRTSTNYYLNQNFNLSFQSIHDKFEYTVGINVDPSYSRSTVNLKDSTIDYLSQRVVNFSPSFRFTYKPKESTSINLDYYGSTSQPSLNQLSADTTIISALSKSYGNPNLKPSYNNNLNIYYQKSDFESGRFLQITGSVNSTFDQIVDFSTIDSLGNSETTYRNVNGNFGANLGFTFNTPLKNKKFTFDTNTYGSYYRNIGFLNGDKNITNNFSISEYTSLSFRSEIFETRLQLNYTFSSTKNNLPNQDDMNVSTFGGVNTFSLKLPYDFKVSNSLSYSYNSGYSSDFKKTEILWNASISKQFLKQKKGTVKVDFYDILKDRNSVTRMVSGNYVSDMRTNMISRYFLVSFIYRFNTSKGDN